MVSDVSKIPAVFIPLFSQIWGSQVQKQAPFLRITHPSSSPADFFPENGDEELYRNDNHPQNPRSIKSLIDTIYTCLIKEDGALFPRLAWVTPLHSVLYEVLKNADTHMALFKFDLNTRHKHTASNILQLCSSIVGTCLQPFPRFLQTVVSHLCR